MSDVTRILSQIDAGDPAAAEQLLPLVYDELRKLAAARLANEKPGQTLQATALVHEAYLRLVAQPGVRNQGSGVTDEGPHVSLTPGSCRLTPEFNSRGHFFAAAAEAMRRILVEQARRRHALKRGGQQQQIELPDVADKEPASAIDVLALDEALSAFAAVDSQAAELVKLRYFAGLSLAEAASAQGVSARTADRTWLYARTWLLNKLISP